MGRFPDGVHEVVSRLLWSLDALRALTAASSHCSLPLYLRSMTLVCGYGEKEMGLYVVGSLQWVSKPTELEKLHAHSHTLTSIVKSCTQNVSLGTERLLWGRGNMIK